MQIAYDNLFHVEIAHSYYPMNGLHRLASDLCIFPSSICLERMKDLGLLFKPKPHGFTVIYEADRTPEGKFLPRRPITDPVKFTFYLVQKNPCLLNFSNLPLPPPKSKVIYRMHNRQDSVRHNQLLLTAHGDSQFLTAEDQIQHKPGRFTLSFETSKASVYVELKNERGDLVEGERIFPQKNRINLPVMLQAHPPGTYTLFLDGKKDSTFYVDDEIKGRNIFGVVEIFHSAGVIEPYQFLDANNLAATKTYTINIDQRRVFWKYYVVKKHQKAVDSNDLTITSPTTDLIFTRLPDITLSNGLTAAPFVSDSSCQMSAAPRKGITLTKANGNGDGAFEIENLANATPMNLKPDKDNDSFYSEIFIYI